MREEIKTENPEEHWADLDVNGKIVMDMGCGRFDSIGRPWDYTPMFFLNQGASRVIGIDANLDDITWYLENYDDKYFVFIHSNIDSKAKILNLLDTFQPTVLKIDIEWGEVNFYDITKKEMANITDLAIETHSEEIHERIREKLTEWGFTIQNDVPIMGHSSRVLFAKK